MKSSHQTISQHIKVLSVVIVIVMTFLVGCSNPFGTGCEKNDTAEVTFKNNSSKTQYDVILDGTRIGSIWPGQSITRDVHTGHHTYVFKFSGTNSYACSEGTPNLSQCSSITYSCSSDK